MGHVATPIGVKRDVTVLLLIVAFFLIVASFLGNEKARLGGLRWLALPFALAGMAWGSFCSVPTGHVGILRRFGAATGTLNPGINFVAPFVSDVEMMEVRTQKDEANAAAASRDLQNVSTDVAVNFHVNPATAIDLYRHVGPGYADRIIAPAVQESVKAVVAQYTAEELIRSREVVKAKIDESLKTRLLAYDLILESVSIKNFAFSEGFAQAIEAKQEAEVAVATAKNTLAKNKVEAESKLVAARAEAESAKVRAAALNSKGGDKEVSRLWIEKWDGHLPQFTSGGQSFMLNLNDMLKNVQETKPAK